MDRLAVNEGRRLLLATRFSSLLRHRALRVAASAALVALIAIALTAALSPGARSAFARFFGLKHIQVVPVDKLPVVLTPPPGFGAVAGLTTLADAQAMAGFTVITPSEPDWLGRPDAVYLQDLEPGRQVVLVYGRRPEAGPFSKDGGALIALFQFRAEGMFMKLSPPGTTVQELERDGVRMLWFEGASHLLKYVSPDGEERVEFERLVDRNTLAWETGDITYRLETSLPLEEALQVALSVR